MSGAGGQLATHVTEQLSAAGDDVLALDRSALDITDAAAVVAALDDHRPDVVVNAAAYTAVDAAEEHEHLAAQVNEVGPRVLAEALASHDGARTARLLHVSTDYVFDGRATRPYEPDDPTGPQGAYGRTKLAGELAVRAALPDRACVVRTAWVFGGPGANFVDTMLRLERERETVDVVADQIGSPTYAGDLAAGLIALGRSDVAGGTLHFANAGQASWFDFAREVFRQTGADPDRVRPTDSAAFARPAARPAWSVLSTAAWVAAGLGQPRPWQDALAAKLARPGA
ncbi:dTDP-4-dehydrorhamnose reductase [uncultured Jatrophihabitans sp.]|uniref:dTDP-4-dehydrorhamnose reductase n=1 Tax=uncultured Jatrophihabitans sp. TaxID=1610747 RepID=UPI0035CAA1B7